MTLKDDLKKNELFDLSAALKKLSSSSSLLVEDENKQKSYTNQDDDGIIKKQNEADNSLKRKFYELDSDDNLSFEKITSEFKRLKIEDIHESARIKRNSQLLEKAKIIIADHNQLLKGCEDPEVFEKLIPKFLQELETCRPPSLLRSEWIKQKLQYSLEACLSSPELDILMSQTKIQKFWSNSSGYELLSSLIFDVMEEL